MAEQDPPIEWRRDALDDLDPPVQGDPNAKGFFIQVWGRAPDGIMRGVLVHVDSKGNLDKYKSGCLPSVVETLCKIECKDCKLEKKYGALVLPPGILNLGQVIIEYECCPC